MGPGQGTNIGKSKHVATFRRRGDEARARAGGPKVRFWRADYSESGGPFTAALTTLTSPPLNREILQNGTSHHVIPLSTGVHDERAYSPPIHPVNLTSHSRNASQTGTLPRARGSDPVSGFEGGASPTAMMKTRHRLLRPQSWLPEPDREAQPLQGGAYIRWRRSAPHTRRR